MSQPSIDAPNAGWLYNYLYYLGLEKNRELDKWVLFPVTDGLRDRLNKEAHRKQKKAYDDKKNPRYEFEPRDLNRQEMKVALEAYQEQRSETYLKNFPQRNEAFDAHLPALGNTQIKLTTTYPGLLLGTGYPHETGAYAELILGMSFDFTTGLPVIPGSSVKGIIRSAFDEKAYPDYVRSLLASDDICGALPEGFQLARLEEEIFGPAAAASHDYDLRLPTQDIFYDAVPLMAESFASEIFGVDTITPHTQGEFIDPVPLPFLKVMPGVTYRFDFEARHSTVLKSLTADKKSILYQCILEDLGIGAKSNVGYGHLINHEDYQGIFDKPEKGKARAYTYFHREKQNHQTISKPKINPSVSASGDQRVYAVEGKLIQKSTKRQFEVTEAPLQNINRKKDKQFDRYRVGDRFTATITIEKSKAQPNTWDIVDIRDIQRL